MENNDKFILDVCCGGRYFWFNKNHPNTIYLDQRQLEKRSVQGVPNFNVSPDVVCNFQNLPIRENSMKVIVWDPPHMTEGNSILHRMYGALQAETWPYDLSKGFAECWRALQDYGVLIFKWSERQIKLNSILKLFPVKPLFGHTTGTRSKCHWMCFMKIP